LDIAYPGGGPVKDRLHVLPGGLEPPSWSAGGWQQALTIYTQLGVPEADQVRSRLRAQEAEQAKARQATG